jgi:hypothetical protein
MNKVDTRQPSSGPNTNEHEGLNQLKYNMAKTWATTCWHLPSVTGRSPFETSGPARFCCGERGTPMERISLTVNPLQQPASL